MSNAATSAGTVRWPLLTAIALVVGAMAGVVIWRRHEPWVHAYLVAWLFWSSLTLGSLAILLLHNLTGGAWGEAIRPLLRAAVAPLPVIAILFVPIAWNVESIYPWADPYHAGEDAALVHKRPYLNVEGFRYRAVGYFVVWLALAMLLAWQARRNPLPESRAGLRLRRLSGQGLALHGIAVTFAAIDWMMSLEPHWFSTIYGVIVFASQGLAAFALAALVFTAMRRRAAATSDALVDAQHDLGKLLLGFVMFWAYTHFSQFFIIWYGNLPEEVVWYQRRLDGAWKAMALGLVFLHFVGPFVLLLSREMKRSAAKLGGVAALLVAMHWIEIVWMVKPAAEASRAAPLWIDLGLTAGIGAAWLVVYGLAMSRQTLAFDHDVRGRHE